MASTAKPSKNSEVIPMRSKLATVLMAFLLVTSGITASTGAASTQTLTDSECTGLVSFIKNAVSLGLTGSGTAACAPTNDAIEDMKESDANQTKVDIYSTGSAEKANLETFNTVYGNYLNDTESVAWMKMQVAVAEAYQDGMSQEQALVEARQAISNYYATKQINQIKQWNTSLSNYRYLREQATNESDISTSFVSPSIEWAHSGEGASWNFGGSRSLSLVNGSTATTAQVHVPFTQTNQVNNYDGTAYLHAAGMSGSDDSHFADVNFDIQPPDGNYDTLTVFEVEDFAASWNEIQTRNSNLQTEAENFVNATYADFSAGEANASDVISANTAMFEYATQSDGSQSLYDSTAALAMMGFDTPNMSSSGTMDVTYQGNTYTGIVLARNAPGGSWETNVTYNTGNITGPVFLATVDGQKLDFAEGTNFTIEQMRTQTGANVTQVNTTNYVYKTANTSELNEMQTQLTDLRKEIESREPSGGGGSGSGLDNQTMLAIGLVAAAALLLGGRDN